MKNKIKIKNINVWTYVFGVIILAFGCSLMTKADLGISMVVAPAYLIHLKISQTYSFFTFGMAEYLLQFLLIAAMSAILGKVKKNYILSFATAVFYGFVLDVFLYFVKDVQAYNITGRIIYYALGMVLSSLGVALFFHTTFSPCAYDYFVREVAQSKNINITVFKTCYDIVSCMVAIVMSFIFFGFMHFEGVKWGTVICALVNGSIIGFFGKVLEYFFDFEKQKYE